MSEANAWRERTLLLAAIAVASAMAFSACDDERADRDDDDNDDNDVGDGGAGNMITTNAGGSATGGAGTGGAGTGGAGGASTGGAATGGAGTGGGPVAIPICLPGCAVPSDCSLVARGGGLRPPHPRRIFSAHLAGSVSLGIPAYDTDNYACDGGHCTYEGCNGDAECMPAGYVCRPGYDPAMIGTTPICVPPCSTPSNCDMGAGLAYDADNYACIDGGCQYTGCVSTAECQAIGNYVCADLGFGVSYCLEACSTPSDCDNGAGPAYDADNYACTAGHCEYIGCLSDAECMTLGDYTCVR